MGFFRSFEVGSGLFVFVLLCILEFDLKTVKVSLVTTWMVSVEQVTNEVGH